MRLGVLDIGSNTVHLLVADARPGGRPLATTSKRTVLRLMRYLAPDDSITDEGVRALVEAVSEARKVAAAENVDELLATATSPAPAWCILDNNAGGHAVADAARLQALLDAGG